MFAGAGRRLVLDENDLLPALLFIALVALAATTPAQNDTWWHLRSGQEMWTTRSLLTTERFSFVTFGQPTDNDWWLSQLAFYGVYSLGGPFLLTLAAGACALAAIVGSWRLMRGGMELRAGALLFLVIASPPEWSVRPQVISLVFLVVVAHLVVRGRVWWIPPLCIVWANTHPMVVFGLLVAVACAAEAVIWSRTHVRRDVTLALACALTPMIAPGGWRYWPQVLSTVSASRAVGIAEYSPALSTADLPFWAGLVGFGVLVWRRWPSLGEHARGDRILVLASAGLALAAMTATRNVAFFAVVAAPAFCRVWAFPSPRLPRTRSAPAPAYVIVFAAVLACIGIVAYRWRDGGRHLGWRPMSEPTIRAVEQCPTSIFHPMEDGGYLMWALPNRRVFIDSRVHAYPLDVLLRARAAELDGDYEQLFRHHGIDCAIAHVPSVLLDRLRGEPSMRLTYQDESHAIFARVVKP